MYNRPMSKTKRMIYIRDENVEFYDALPNKSEFLNDKLTEARTAPVVETEPPTAPELPDTPQNAVDAMRARDKQRLADYRKANGLYNPTEA